MHSYRVYMHQGVLDFILGRKAADRSRLLRFFNDLSDDPFLQGSEFTYDEEARRNEIVYVGRFRLVFWADHPVKEVKIIKIELVKFPS